MQNCAAEYQQMEWNRKRRKQKPYTEPESGKKDIRSNKARVQLEEYDWYISRMKGEELDKILREKCIFVI